MLLFLDAVKSLIFPLTLYCFTSTLRPTTNTGENPIHATAMDCHETWSISLSISNARVFIRVESGSYTQSGSEHGLLHETVLCFTWFDHDGALCRRVQDVMIRGT